MAKNELDACFTSSALFVSVTISGISCAGGTLREQGKRNEDLEPAGKISFIIATGTQSFRSDHDTVGMKEVANSGAFAEKFRIGDDIKFQAIDIVNREMLPEALCRLHRHRRFSQSPGGSHGRWTRWCVRRTR